MSEDLARLLHRGREATKDCEHHLALELFRRAHKLNATNTEALLGIALSASRVGRDKDATAAYLVLAEVCIRASNMDLAYRAVERILAREPDNLLALRFSEFVQGRRRPESGLDEGISFGRGTGDDWGSLYEETFFDEAGPTNVREPSEVSPMPHIKARTATFSDVTTRAVSTGQLETLKRQSRGDIFAQVPTARVSRKILGELIEECADPEAVVANIEQLSGGSLDAMSDWDAATTVAVAGAHIDFKRIRSEPERWTESEFPLYGTTDFTAPARTIQLGGAGAAIAFAQIATKSPFLVRLGWAGCQDLLARCDVLQIFAGQVLTTEGETGNRLRFLLLGRAAVERMRSGRPHHVATLAVGDFFSECAILGGGIETATVRATEDALVLEIEEKVVKELVESEPDLLRELTRELRMRFVTKLFGDHNCFESLSDAARDALAARLELHKAREGAIIVPSTVKTNGLWFLMAGAAERWHVGHSSPLAPSSVFGASSAGAEVVATKSSWLLRLSPGDAAVLFHEHPELIAAFT